MTSTALLDAIETDEVRDIRVLRGVDVTGRLTEDFGAMVEGEVEVEFADGHVEQHYLARVAA